MNEKWDEIRGKLDLVRVRGEFELSEFEISRFYSTNTSKKKKQNKTTTKKQQQQQQKNSEINRPNIFCWKIKAEGSVIFQKVFSSMADFRDIVSVMPCSATDKGK